MSKSFMSPDAIDSAINTLCRVSYSDEAAGDEIRTAQFLVIGEDLPETHIDRPEIARAAMIEEFNKLSHEQQNAVNRGAQRVFEERLMSQDREHAKSMLRWLMSLGSA